MLFMAELTVPQNTLETNPVTQELVLTRGTITRVSVAFPPGPSGLVHVILKNKAFQLWPSSPETSLAWDDYVISWAEDYEINEYPFNLTLVGWSEDTIYSHKVTLWLELLAGAIGWKGFLSAMANQGHTD